MSMKILSVWIFSLLISSPLFLLGLLRPNSIYDYKKLSCEINSTGYKLFGSLFAFYIPLFIILITYTLTMRFLTNLARSKVNNNQVSFKYTTTNTNVSEFKEHNLNSNYNSDFMKQQPKGYYSSKINRHKELSNSLKSKSVSYDLVVKNSEFGSKLNNFCLNSFLLTNQTLLPFLRYDLDLKCKYVNSINNNNNSKNNIYNRRSTCFELGNNDGCRKLALNLKTNKYNSNNKRFIFESIFSDRSKEDLIMYFTLIKNAIKTSNEIEEMTSNRMSSFKNESIKSPNKSSSVRSEYGHTSYSHNILNNTDLLMDECSTKLKNSLKTRRNTNCSSHVPTYNRTRSSNNGNNEKKALKVLIVIFLVFIFLWAPFFILNVLSTFYCKNQIECELYLKKIISIATWLGYISSMANPIIYTMFSKNFRKAFLDLLKLKKLKTHKRFLRKI